jgi:hypothetical protein
VNLNTNDYEREFNNAIERTDSWGMCAPYFRTHPRRVTEENGNEISQYIQSALGRFSAEQISRQCIAVAFFMKEELESLLNTSLMYTLGYVEFNKRNVFYTPEAELKAMLSNTLTQGAVNLHAWLTTPSYEIIDPTFWTTYGVVNNDPECIGSVMMQHYSLFNQHLIHHPQIVGEEYLYDIGGIIELD